MGGNQRAAVHVSVQSPRRSPGTTTDAGTTGISLGQECLLENLHYWSRLQDENWERKTAMGKTKEQNTIWYVKNIHLLRSTGRRINVPEISLKKNKQSKPIMLDHLITRLWEKDFEELQEFSNCRKKGTFTMPISVEKRRVTRWQSIKFLECD